MATRNKKYIGKILHSFTGLESMIYKIRSNDEAICPAVSQHNGALTSVMHQHPLQPTITDTGRGFPPETSNHDQSASNLQKTGNVEALCIQRENYLTIDIGRRREQLQGGVLLLYNSAGTHGYNFQISS